MNPLSYSPEARAYRVVKSMSLEELKKYVATCNEKYDPAMCRATKATLPGRQFRADFLRAHPHHAPMRLELPKFGTIFWIALGVALAIVAAVTLLQT